MEVFRSTDRRINRTFLSVRTVFICMPKYFLSVLRGVSMEYFQQCGQSRYYQPKQPVPWLRCASDPNPLSSSRVLSGGSLSARPKSSSHQLHLSTEGILSIDHRRHSTNVRFEWRFRQILPTGSLHPSIERQYCLNWYSADPSQCGASISLHGSFPVVLQHWHSFNIKMSTN